MNLTLNLDLSKLLREQLSEEPFPEQEEVVNLTLNELFNEIETLKWEIEKLKNEKVEPRSLGRIDETDRLILSERGKEKTEIVFLTTGEVAKIFGFGKTNIASNLTHKISGIWGNTKYDIIIKNWIERGAIVDRYGAPYLFRKSLVDNLVGYPYLNAADFLRFYTKQLITNAYNISLEEAEAIEKSIRR